MMDLFVNDNYKLLKTNVNLQRKGKLSWKRSKSV